LVSLSPFPNGVAASKHDHQKYLSYKDEALNFAEKRIDKFSKINIKKQKIRWDSCSSKESLNFNYKILFLPKGAADYIIVYELYHLKEFSHLCKLLRNRFNKSKHEKNKL